MDLRTLMGTVVGGFVVLVVWIIKKRLEDYWQVRRDTRAKLDRVVDYLQKPQTVQDWQHEWDGADWMISQARVIGLPRDFIQLMESLRGLIGSWQHRIPSQTGEQDRQFRDLINWTSRSGNDIRVAFERVTPRLPPLSLLSPFLWYSRRQVRGRTIKLRQELDGKLGGLASDRPQGGV
jgi:hypothetical protein